LIATCCAIADAGRQASAAPIPTSTLPSLICLSWFAIREI
jgi:hypothetical protein